MKRTFHAVSKHTHNPILTADQPWEGIDAYLNSQREKSPDTDLQSRKGEVPENADGYGGWVLIYGTVLFAEPGNQSLLGGVPCFTFEPHVRRQVDVWGFKHENIYYFDDNGEAVEL